MNKKDENKKKERIERIKNAFLGGVPAYKKDEKKMTREEELKKGCNERWYNKKTGLYYDCLSESWLCPECQAELKGIQEGKAQGYKLGQQQKGDIMKKQWQDEEKAQANKDILKMIDEEQDTCHPKSIEGKFLIRLKERIKHLNHSHEEQMGKDEKDLTNPVRDSSDYRRQGAVKQTISHTLRGTNNKQEKQRG